MAQALFLICLFLITVCSLLLFKPPIPKSTLAELKSITEYSNAESAEYRQQIALKMARFLEKNPKIVKQERLTSLPVESMEIDLNAGESDQQEITFQKIIDIRFQGADLQFKSQNEFENWLRENLRKDPVSFIRELKGQQDAVIYLDTLKQISEISTDESVVSEIKSAYLDEAKRLIQIQNNFEQELTQKALQQYLDLEKNLELGKKTVETFLKTHQSVQNQTQNQNQ
jgi:hypothetical protein